MSKHIGRLGFGAFRIKNKRVEGVISAKDVGFISIFQQSLLLLADKCYTLAFSPTVHSYLLAAMKTITATMIVPQIAALAAIVILSMLDAGEATVRTSRHWV